MDGPEMRRRVAAARVGRLATLTADGSPHVVPVCFAFAGEDIVSAVDAKPKSTYALRRLDNVRADPRASLLVDHYDDRDWTRLWWVRVDGEARVLEDGDDARRAIAELVSKYSQYRAEEPAGPVIAITPTNWRSWG